MRNKKNRECFLWKRKTPEYFISITYNLQQYQELETLMNLTEIKHIGKTGIKRIKNKSSCKQGMWTTATMTQDLVWNLRTLKFLPLLNIQKKKTYLCKMFECWVVKNFYAKQNLVCITNIQFMVDFKQHMIQTHHGYMALL